MTSCFYEMCPVAGPVHSLKWLIYSNQILRGDKDQQGVMMAVCAVGSKSDIYGCVVMMQDGVAV